MLSKHTANIEVRLSRTGNYIPAGTILGEQAIARVEGVLVISDVHFTHFDNIINVDGDVVRMTFLPEDIVFRPGS